MPLLSEERAPVGTQAHRLRPLVEVERGKRRTVAWVCLNCDEDWPELPPVPERLTGCTG